MKKTVCNNFVPNGRLNCPKDPAVLKLSILRRNKFTTRGKFTIAQGFAMASPPALTQFSWVLQAFSLRQGFTA